MRTSRIPTLAICAALSGAMTACDLDVGDLNNPSLTDLQNNPNRVSLNAAATGLLISDRIDQANEIGYVPMLGILGRECYVLDGADGRFVSEMLQGPLLPGSPFGGTLWAIPYGNIALADVILAGVAKVDSTQLDDGEKAGMRGFTKTIEALSLLKVAMTHETNGEVIDTSGGIKALGPIVDYNTTLTHIAAELDDAATDLSTTDAAFSFQLSDGFKGFDDPPSFLKFNRALKARVSVYLARPPGGAVVLSAYQDALDALAQSFIDEGDSAAVPTVVPDFNVGVYYSFSTSSGDLTNAMSGPNLYSRPLNTDAGGDVEMNGDKFDARYTAKINQVSADNAGSLAGKSSNLRFDQMYPSPNSPLALIRNEELILLKAEATFYRTAAHTDFLEAYRLLNIVRTGSGELGELTTDDSPSMFQANLLYERRWSLLMEWGHRWIDLRRFGVPLPLDPPDADSGDSDVRNMRFPIPNNECNARPTEPRCKLGSLDN